ncbi:hypothetical protein L228DRAFT_246800 [Xylona heveae TC161]|uniref:Uncharacterized protein n=1 Tax=Xylona heveae (strain CBS 132557 / TC161) TaxID=1328760 RepID=A0A165GRB3_XYLHT|nr:hypothetical protein L228DRAFT_246800 [Xylona heveae TC161]KZF22496.1 hypothetical protein L228DRAFT_246800 [Xylona heveae TC161]
MAKMPDLRKAGLTSPTTISSSSSNNNLSVLQNIFNNDEKLAKQILNAAKRVSKKRSAPTATESSNNDATPSSGASHGQKRRKTSASTFSSSISGNLPGLEKEEQEDALRLPEMPTSMTEEELSNTILHTNRAPLVLAFAVVLLKYTMPEQPLSSRLSLAQAYVSISSRSRAVSLGLESGKSAEEEGWGQGQPVVRVMGKDICVLRRWDYETDSSGLGKSTSDNGAGEETKQNEEESGLHSGDNASQKEQNASLDSSSGPAHESQHQEQEQDQNRAPALWGLDLEALKASNTKPGGTATRDRGKGSITYGHLPIYTPQSARDYLLRSFASGAHAKGSTATTGSPREGQSRAQRKGQGQASAAAAEKERNLGLLLKALDLLYASWAPVMSAEELDRKSWPWYAQVRPAVEHGVAGWGGKNEVKLGDILALRRRT